MGKTVFHVVSNKNAVYNLNVFLTISLKRKGERRREMILAPKAAPGWSSGKDGLLVKLDLL